MKIPYISLVSAVILSIGISSCGQNKASQQSASNKTEPTAETIRVLTYNIHHANPPEKEGKIDLKSIAEVIRESKADLVAIQELDSVTERSQRNFQLKSLADELDMNFHFFSAIPFQGGAYGVGILSRFPISEPQKIALPEATDKNAEDRILGILKIKLPSEKNIYFGTTHWDVSHQENRELQAKATNEAVRQLDGPIIIGGDFNAKTDSKPMNLLRQVFTDASKEFAPTIPTENPNRRIDHILYHPGNLFKLQDEEVMMTPLSQVASDHLPFWVDLVVLD